MNDLEDEISKTLASEIQREIDNNVLFTMLMELGWHKVQISRFIDNKHAVDITYWLKENIRRPYERNGSVFVFQEEKDANWFKLRWLA
mgnify:CR=1 FL=1